MAKAKKRRSQLSATMNSAFDRSLFCSHCLGLVAFGLRRVRLQRLRVSAMVSVVFFDFASLGPAKDFGGPPGPVLMMT